jgi:hypothetical protein
VFPELFPMCQYGVSGRFVAIAAHSDLSVRRRAAA